MQDFGKLRLVDERAAIKLLAADLPEFQPEDYGTHEDGSPLFHMTMGDLYRFYDRAEQDDLLASRYWAIVERIAAEGSASVENAVAVSLIENFAGDPLERFQRAKPRLGPVTLRIAADFDL